MVCIGSLWERKACLRSAELARGFRGGGAGSSPGRLRPRSEAVPIAAPVGSRLAKIAAGDHKRFFEFRSFS